MIRTRPALGFIYIAAAVMAALYFMFAAIQGDYGLFRRIELNAEADALRTELGALRAEQSNLENLTHRLSDAYLDLDLLDERARNVLGYVRADEVVGR
ncbi:FtsB family cell division protein [Ketogulonicigenium vulgare]|uniref:Septum formation initiator n=1 Tax=Ketogulonicigenium vulgare (strain WSH-001) TaxID=759362 RepID=F9Y473_KETVW|nr:septum formation initiator family protein [Ketogulonicigenium vulgare]ADO42315.1 septum formation initiator [Ketogulonicigenium vulgare Y25]AEM40509.1 Septum formation initiator [Ketogulonicigenium vulgare WSH-001]ALJ80694.1 septum formation initiator precursor [Ketogulonicigenium vulgare]ANW34959.1 septum formation initiator precursor [Ketogulonicigenium vulgare]AOZ54226.1 septum formation initiator [Ketogulonicigenium vulgare]